MKEEHLTTYEQPANEAMRLCLKLEYLLAHFDRYVARNTLYDTDIAMVALMKMLDILGRPDLKSKLTQLLSSCLSVLSRLQEHGSPELDSDKLSKLCNSVQQQIETLQQTPGKIGEQLSTHPLFSQLRSHFQGTWGSSHVSMPAYLAWLQRIPAKRAANLARWTEEFTLLKHVVSTVLKIARETATVKKIKTTGGAYQEALNPNLPCQMIRLVLNAPELVYPEMSVGRHRFVVRFLLLNMDQNQRPQQIVQDIHFTLQCCIF